MLVQHALLDQHAIEALGSIPSFEKKKCCSEYNCFVWIVWTPVIKTSSLIMKINSVIIIVYTVDFRNTHWGNGEKEFS
jgi:hypothetical protein